jgi:glycosyltransferase involved in cell wall biosynthesis
MGTCAIIVTYFPDPEVFGRLIDAIRDDVDAIAIVNNGGVLPPVSEPSKVHEIRNEANVGLSPALNQGIAWATEHNFTSVIFFDHDSQPSRDMIATLHRSLDSLVSRGVRVRLRAGGSTCRHRVRLWRATCVGAALDDPPLEHDDLVGIDMVESRCAITSVVRFADTRSSASWISFSVWNRAPTSPRRATGSAAP